MREALTTIAPICNSLTACGPYGGYGTCGALAKGVIPPGSSEMITDGGKPGFFGPCPPIGRKHTYIYTVYALKTEKLDVPVTSTPGYVGFNLWANTLGKATFSVTAGPRK